MKPECDSRRASVLRDGPVHLRPVQFRAAWLLLCASLLLPGCALPRMAQDALASLMPAPPAAPAKAPVPPPPPLQPPVQAPAPPPVAATPFEPPPAKTVLDYADRVARMPGTVLAQEISFLGDPGDSAVRQMQLAIALAATGVPSDVQRSQQMLNRIAHDPAADDTLRPLARLLVAQQASLRRADEQVERQGQQLRDAQKRIDQLSDRLEAMRAVERSMTARRPASAASAADGRTP